MNLEVALRYLRLHFELRVLWIDAICINQTDLREKSDQLLGMRDLYANAPKVLVWLDVPDSDLRAAIRYMHDDCGEFLRIPEMFDPHFRPSSEKGVGVMKMLSNAWWSRMWTAQELVVARSDIVFLYGQVDIPWQQFYLFILLLRNSVAMSKRVIDMNLNFVFPLLSIRQRHRKVPEEESLRRRFEGNRHLRLETNYRPTLENLLIATSDRKSMDPKDKIFAVLSMLANEHETFRADYQDSISHVYQKAMVAAIRSSEDLYLLKYAPPPKKESRYGIPSWCIDFSVQKWNHNHRKDKNLFPRHNILVEVGLGHPFKVEHHLDKGLLKVIGSPIGRISSSHLATRPADWDLLKSFTDSGLF